MATVMTIPRVMLLLVARNVIIPSGMLWKIMAIMEKIPSLYSFFVWFSLAIILSKNIDNIRPIIIYKLSQTNEIFLPFSVR